MMFSKYNIDSDYSLLALMNITLRDKKSIRLSNALLNRVDFLKVDSDIEAKKITIPSFDGQIIDLYIYRVRDSEDKLPAIVYYHGGGFFLKGDALSPKILSAYAREFNVSIVYVDYRLSIDFPFPIPPEDCFWGLKWVYENCDFINIDRDRIMVMGFSAGGALAASVTLMARDRGLDIIKAQLLICPVTDHRQITKSVKEFTDTPNWTSSRNKFMWELYLRNTKGEIPYYASPCIAPSFKGLPPAYIEVSEFDPLHDEGINYGISLKDAGIFVDINDSKGTIHMSSIVLKANKTQENISRMGKFIKKSLNE